METCPAATASGPTPGRGIRTLDPNLGKREFVPSLQSARLNCIVLRAAGFLSTFGRCRCLLRRLHQTTRLPYVRLSCLTLNRWHRRLRRPSVSGHARTATGAPALALCHWWCSFLKDRLRDDTDDSAGGRHDHPSTCCAHRRGHGGDRSATAGPFRPRRHRRHRGVGDSGAADRALLSRRAVLRRPDPRRRAAAAEAARSGSAPTSSAAISSRGSSSARAPR